MALFNKDKKDSLVKEVEEKSSKSKKNTVNDTKKVGTVFGTKNSLTAYNVLLEPWVTEKTHSMLEVNKYAFKVANGSTKIEVKNAIEGIYGVKIEKISAVNISSKTKYFGRRKGIRSGFKKMIVTLRKGDSIELFQGA